MTMSLCTSGYSYPFMNDIYSKSQPIPSTVPAALTNQPLQTDLQKLNKPISSSSDPYLYGIITHLLEFLTKVDNMRLNIKRENPDHFLCIKISETVKEIIVEYKLVQKVFTLSNALLILNAIELFINILLRNLISTIKDGNGKNADRWRDMKKQLIELSKFVDRILLHYKHQSPANPLPNIDEVVLVKEQIIKLLNKIRLCKVQKYLVGEDMCVSPHELLVSTIGLKCEIGKQVELAQTHFPGHQTDLYYLKKIIRENIESNLEKSSSILLELSYADILEKSGFTISKASMLAAFISANDPHRHQSLVYWIDTYLDFIFKYDIFLNDTCPQFPHKEDELNRWFTLSTEREDDEGVVSNIDVYYINKSTDNVSLQDNDCHFPQISEKRSNFWYHGTDHKSAEHIRLNGIDIHKGKEKQDFSDGYGFYLTPYYQYAYDWASKRCTLPVEGGAVLIFECSFDEFLGVDCFGNNESELKKIITYFRSGKLKVELPNKSLRKRLKNRADFIQGQMSGDGSKYKPGGSWEPTIKTGNASQLCIKSEEMALKFSYKLKGIIFFAAPLIA